MTSEEPTEEVLDRKKELHSMALLPSVAQFVSLYRFAFKLPEIEIEELEDGLLEENEVGGKVLQELLVSLMKGIQPSRGINASNLEEHLLKQLRRFRRLEKADETNEKLSEEEEGAVTFSQIAVASKVEFLHYLCCMRVDRPDAQDAMKTMDADALRVQPLGNDDQGNEYWYFFGTRLYKQEPAKEKAKDWKEEWNHQKDQSFNKRGRGRGRPRKAKLRKSDGESDDFEDAPKDGRYMNIDEKSRWSVVCNTIEDWVDFAEKLKASKSKSEKALFQTVTDNFLPVLNEIYQEKERRLQQKLRELVPRRVITRRETRKQRVKSLQELNGYDAETAHREHLARDRAQRLEERNRRSSQSTDRSKLRSSRRKYMEDEEEDDYEDEDDYRDLDVESPPQSEDSSDYRKEYIPVIAGETSDLKAQVLKVLSEVKLQKDAWPFLYPVDESYAPGYYEIITDPMDLSTMSSKLLDNGYKTIGHIDEDFKKMVDNCKLYNGENSGMSNMVMNLWRIFRRGMSKIGNPSAQSPDATLPAEPTISCATEFPKETEDESRDFQMRRSSQSQDTRKRKKRKLKDMEALEVLSREAKLAVERTHSDEMDGPQPPEQRRQAGSLYSDLKIVPIHSHPQSLIERFSDSSNHEVDDLDSSNASASSYLEANSDSGKESPPAKADAPPPSPYFHQNDDCNDLSEFIAKSLSDNPSMLSNAEAGSPRGPVAYDASRSPKMSPSGNDVVEQGEVNIVEQCGADNNMSSLMSGLPREAMYSVDGRRTSPSVAMLNNTNFHRKSSQDTFAAAGVPSAAARNSTSEGEHMQRSDACTDMATVDASALGISHLVYPNKQNEAGAPSTVGAMCQSLGQSVEGFPSTNPFAKVLQSSPKRKPRYSPTFPSQLPSPNQFQPPSAPSSSHQSQDFQSLVQYQTHKPGTNSSVANNIATFTTHMQGGSKTFHNQGQMVLQPAQDSNKYPTMKVSLPPSTGELLVVPGDSVNAGMTFHLFAQPHSNPSQPLQSRMQVFPDGSVQHQSNHALVQQQNSHGVVLQHQNSHGVLQHQSNQGAANNVEHRMTTISKGPSPSRDDARARDERSPKRKSPVQDPQQFTSSAMEPTTTMPYQLPFTTKSMQSVQVLPRYTEAYVGGNAAPTYSNITSSSLVRPNALRHHNPGSTNPVFTASGEAFASNTRAVNTFAQQNAAPIQTTAPVFPTYSYRQASVVNGVNTCSSAATVTNSKPQPPARMSLQKVYLPPGAAMAQSAVVQNGSGQFVLWPQQQTKDGTKRSTSGGTSQEGAVPRTTVADAVTSAPAFYPGANNMFTFQTAPGNPSQLYAQVLPSQLPQYVNQGTPYYIVTDPNSLQGPPQPQRYPLMGMQPIPFPNR